MTDIHIEREPLRPQADAVQRYRVTLLGTDEVICMSTRTPLYAAARALLEGGGAGPEDRLCLHRPGNPQVDAFGQVGELAKLTMTFRKDGEDQTEPYKPFSRTDVLGQDGQNGSAGPDVPGEAP